MTPRMESFAFVGIPMIVAYALLWWTPSMGGEQMLCHLEPMGDGWHYRTKVEGRSDRCYYLGERMKPRSELYWAEVPAIPMATPKVENGEFELRWKGESR